MARQGRARRNLSTRQAGSRRNGGNRGAGHPPTRRQSTVKAFVDIQISGVNLKGCKIVHQDGQKPWLATPSVKSEHGWQNVVELSKPLRDAATALVLAAWEALP